MNQKKLLTIVLGVVALIAAVFFGVNKQGADNPLKAGQEFVGTDAMNQLMTTNSLIGNLDAGANYTVYVTRTGKRYHTQDCRYVLWKKTSLNRLDAIEEGYTPCKHCKPDERKVGLQ